MVRKLTFVLLTGFILLGFVAPGLSSEITGEVIIYHAGSLKEPLSEMQRQFQTKHPQVTINLTGGGSTKMARMIADAGKPADIMASADYRVIDNVLIPGKAQWNVKFAANQMVLCFTEKSRYGKEINSRNWYEILSRQEVKWGHTDPNLDPAGYRGLMVLQLAEIHYKNPGLYQRLIANRPRTNVFADAGDMVQKLKNGHLDYAWEYLSMAVQHKLNHIVLPDEVNLGNYALDNLYDHATVEVTGGQSGKMSIERGRSITYGVTLIKDAPNEKAAVAFLQYMLSPDGGLKILKEHGQPPLIPCRVPSKEMKERLPVLLQELVGVE